MIVWTTVIFSPRGKRLRIGYTFPASKSKLGRGNPIHTRRCGRLSFERAAFLLVKCQGWHLKCDPLKSPIWEGLRAPSGGRSV
uniref:Uncharacterized protein n=1 Tax=Myoviridae sp. cteBs22 TaxID=2826675 RepID=A0A8S5R1L3_9CAUD|nr:MAG TPA: hypothetical protein [Myoviridae sp. cteBs22]